LVDAAYIEAVRDIFRLDGRVALVTGAMGALGRSICTGLAVHGADVAVTDLDVSGAEDLTEAVLNLGRRALSIPCNVTDPDSVDRMVAETMAAFGKVDVLITCAGINLPAPAESMPLEDWQRILDVNTVGTFLCCQRVAREMIHQGGVRIVTISSVRGAQGHTGGYSAYSASKGAVDALTRQLACEWAGYRINVNALAPIIFKTLLTERIFSDEAMEERFTSRIPLGRIAVPEDFIGAAVFLASDASGFMTGQTLYVDGGGLIG
jgi:NAD(P)-dependent dehydrogenase (short-subunit alcohol dehydrogenase family)